MDATNTHHVLDWLWTSGQLSEADIASLPELGIEIVINLATPSSSNALPGEAELVAREGISYFQIPVEWENPQLDQLEQFFCFMNAFKNRKVWVHCALNMRVSAFIYLYRRIVRMEDETASSWPLREVWEPNETWRAFISKALTGKTP